MVKLNDFFEHVFCLTLELNSDNPEHPERLQAAIKEFEKHGISVELINGIDGRNLDIAEPMSSDGDSVVRKADMGCTLSHLSIAMQARDMKLGNYCVFEDDVILADNFQEMFDIAITQLPNEWNMVYLGGDNQVPYPNADKYLNPRIFGTHRTLTTHAMGVNACIYDKLIDVLQRHEKVDLNISSLHIGPGFYTFDPPIAGQRAGYSYILGKEVQNEHKFFKV